MPPNFGKYPPSKRKAKGKTIGKTTKMNLAIRSPRRAPGKPRRAQRQPRTASGESSWGSPHERPKKASESIFVVLKLWNPGEPQESPGEPQESPRKAQERPREPRKAPRRAPGEPRKDPVESQESLGRHNYNFL